MSCLGWDRFPAAVTIRSEKTGNTRTFRESCRDVKGGELVCVHYRSQDGIKLVINNE